MAGTPPRRSSRAARTSAPNGSHHSSTSSNSSGRPERTTRARAGSPRKSTPSDSLSSEPASESVTATIEEPIQTRRKRRGETEDQGKQAKAEPIEMANGADDAADDDEAVRCICGYDEYPGLPPPEEDSKAGVKSSAEPELITAADMTEDLAGFFLQCDTCKVWQHGGCVGIKNEDMSPEEYFCEECRRDFHKIFTAINGQQYSHYLPLYQTLSPRTSSRAASFAKDGTKSPKSSKNGRPTSSGMQSTKRRSTMNSRDAAYDEGEQMRRAIEASKKENGGSGSVEGTTRRGKRGRSDSEEKQHESTKRQRTQSNSPPASQDAAPPASQNDSDDALPTRNSSGKRIRGAAKRNHLEKEQREEVKRQRLEQQSKRENRAQRRRVDDSDPSDEVPLANRAHSNKPAPTPTIASAPTAPAVPEPPASTPSPPPAPPKEKEAEKAPEPEPEPEKEEPPPPPPVEVKHRKGGRPPGKKSKLGRNQHTRDTLKELAAAAEDAPSPHGRSASRDVRERGAAGDDISRPGTAVEQPEAKDSERKEGGGKAEAKTDVEESSSKPEVVKGPGRGRGARSSGINKVSMQDMKKRVSGILNYISRVQIEMAGDDASTSGGSDGGHADRADAKNIMRALADSLPMIRVNGVDGGPKGADGSGKREFKDLSLLEMMDCLTRELVMWQKEFT